MRCFVSLLLIAAVVLSCPIIENNLPLLAEPPIHLASVPNGEKLIMGDLKDANQNYLFVAKLKGTPYEMGLALGQLFPEQIKATLVNFYDYYIGQLVALLEKKVPAFLAKNIGMGLEGLVKRILDLNVMITKRYTNPRYYQEIKGIAEGAKIPAKDLQRLNLFPQLIKAACTVAGVWKNATSKGQTLHLRSLDWDSHNPISKFPVVIVYHPSDPMLQTHANFGWAGFVGSMTGMSAKVSLGEKVWIPPKHSVKTTRYGNPWTYVFRDVLYEAVDMKSALAIIYGTHRTCSIHIGLASAADKDFRMFQYSQVVVNNYNDQNYSHYDAKSHPKVAGIAYFDKHVQPSGDSCVGQILTNPDFYGKWEIESLWRVVGLTHTTGDTQLAVFDLQNQLAIVSYASADGKHKAYERHPFFIDMAALFRPF